jgi:hypothetical protein
LTSISIYKNEVLQFINTLETGFQQGFQLLAVIFNKLAAEKEDAIA